MFPIMLVIKDRSCLVVGGGGVALRKVQNLVEEGARVTVVAKDAVEPLHELASEGRITLQLRAYASGEAAHHALVFAATDDRDVNRRVFADADAADVWVNVADDPELCSFHLPARVRRGPLQLAIGSAGEAPFVVRRLRQLLERRFGPEWAEWLRAAGRFRTAVRNIDPNPSRREDCYDRFFDATVDRERLRARVPTAAEVETWLGAPVDTRSADNATAAGTTSCQPTPSGGFVSLVGAGPGCPTLVTVRGRQRLLEANAVVYDRLAAAALPCELAPEVELYAVGKCAGNHPVPQDEINALLVRLAREGRRVVRLKGGDPYVFGRGGEEAEALHLNGIPFEVVPGVTSGIAAGAWVGVPVTHRREAVRLTLLTAHEAIKSGGPQVRWDLLAQDPHATIVGYMGLTALPGVVRSLLEAGMDPQTPAAMVEQATTSAQRRVVATIAELPSAVARARLKPPAVFIIGPTVGHCERLDWFGGLPLAGRRLLVPASSREVRTALEAAGADVVALPSPVTPAARVVMAALPVSGCVVRSSAEVDWLDEERGGPAWPDHAPAWCLGSEASARARERGWQQVHEIREGLSCAELVERIARSESGRKET